jgi:hypothetical protein
MGPTIIGERCGVECNIKVSIVLLDHQYVGFGISSPMKIASFCTHVICTSKQFMDYLLCWSDFLKEIFQLVQLMGNIAGGDFKFVSFFFVMA